MPTVCQSEVEYQARERYGSHARIFPYSMRLDGVVTTWHGLAVRGDVIGLRRALAELPALIERGPAMGILVDGKERRSNSAADTCQVPQDPTHLDPCPTS